MNIAFFESITPYWVNLQEHLYTKHGFNMYFIKKEYLGYDMDDLISMTTFIPHYFAEESKRPGISMNKSKNIWRFRELFQILKENNPDLVISVEFSLLTVQLILLKYLTFRKYKVIVRTDDSFYLIKHGWSIKHIIARKIVSKFTDAFILCDKRVYDLYIGEKYPSIFFPIIQDDIMFRKKLVDALAPSNSYIDDYGLLGKKVVLFVGRLIELKNVGLIIKSLNRLNRQDIVFVVVGSGDGSKDDRERLWKEEASKSCQKVFFVGQLTGQDLLAWYNVANVLVLPSIREAFGAVVNEALLAGCECIVSDAAGSASIIEDGVNGYVFESNNIEDLTSKLQRTLECNPCSFRNTIRDSKMLFSFKQIIEDVDECLSKLKKK